MEDVVWYRKPLLSEPVAILAFEGWSDAGNTATGCVENLSCTYDVDPFAELDSDSYYNYQMRRLKTLVKETFIGLKLLSIQLRITNSKVI